MAGEQGRTPERQAFLRRRAEEQARTAVWAARWAALLAKKVRAACCVNTPHHHSDGEPRPCPNRA